MNSYSRILPDSKHHPLSETIGTCRRTRAMEVNEDEEEEVGEESRNEPPAMTPFLEVSTRSGLRG